MSITSKKMVLQIVHPRHTYILTSNICIISATICCTKVFSLASSFLSRSFFSCSNSAILFSLRVFSLKISKKRDFSLSILSCNQNQFNMLSMDLRKSNIQCKGNITVQKSIQWARYSMVAIVFI